MIKHSVTHNTLHKNHGNNTLIQTDLLQNCRNKWSQYTFHIKMYCNYSVPVIVQLSEGESWDPIN